MKLALLLAALLCAAFARPQDTQDDVRFVAFDVLIDSADVPLAAWQLELEDTTGRATIVGVEGGEHPAYAEPAYYDPRALTQGRIVLAAFSTADSLPVGKTRVARVHAEVRGPEPFAWFPRLTVAGAPDGRQISVRVQVLRSR